MSRATAIILGAALLAAPAAASAQQRFAIELRPELAVPVSDLSDASLDAGFGFEVVASYRIMPHVSVYGGWDWHRFSTDEFAGVVEADVEETGYAFGLRFQHPIGSSETMAFRAHAGGMYNHVEVEDADGELSQDTGHGLGWEAGVGAAFRLGDAWEVSPGLRLRSLERDFEAGSFGPVTATLQYIGIGVGFARWF